MAANLKGLSIMGKAKPNPRDLRGSSKNRRDRHAKGVEKTIPLQPSAQPEERLVLNVIRRVTSQECVYLR